MNVLIVGMGEVGAAHYKVLKDSHTADVWGEDTDPTKRQMDDEPKHFDVMIVAIRYTKKFLEIVKGYVDKYQPDLIINCSTVPVGTTKKIRYDAVHSTTRGLHPNLDEGLTMIAKHIGGQKAEAACSLFALAGIHCVLHRQAKTTELAHILNNVAYGINLMFADEMQRICRYYGVDYYQAVMKYTETNNEGYRRLDNDSKVRPILTPPNKKIGGHCVIHSAELLDPKVRGEVVEYLISHGGPKQ